MNHFDFFELCRTGSKLKISKAIADGVDVNATDEAERTALMYAAESNPNVDIIKTLIEAHADVNIRDSSGRTAVMYATKSNPNVDIIKALIEAGANVNIRDNNGLTALMYFAESTLNTDIIRVLIEAKADINIRDNNGRTALMHVVSMEKNAIHTRFIACVLMNYGADAHITDNEGKWVMDYAKDGNIFYMKKLREHIDYIDNINYLKFIHSQEAVQNQKE